MHLMLQTLAAGDEGWIKLIVLLIVGVIWVVKAIASAIQEQAKRNAQRNASAEGPAPSALPGAATQSVQERLRQIKEHRQRQMASGQKAGGSGKPASTVLVNGGKAQLAEQLRRQLDQERVERQREAQAAARRNELQKKAAAEAAARRRAAQDQKWLDREAQYEAAEDAGPRQAVARHAEAKVAPMEVRPDMPGHHQQVHRHVPDAPGNGVGKLARQLTTLTPQGLRQVIVLKEVLEKPLSLREPGAMPYEM
jgi:hypothetical protein